MTDQTPELRSLPMSLMSWRRQSFRGTPATLIVAAAVFVLVAGVGAAVSFWGDKPSATGARTAAPSPRSRADGDLARLESYTRSIATEKPAPAAAGDMLPDVNTMIERLAARLEAAPADMNGWRMLGWSYLNTGRYEEAASAYARALALDPGSAELKRLHEEAKAKAAGGGQSETASIASSGKDPHAGQPAQPEATTPIERNPAIRAMVDGLAARLEGSPRDVEGWARLMRSRIVLGERDVAVTAYRKARDVFKDDAAALGQLAAAANELGLKAE